MVDDWRESPRELGGAGNCFGASILSHRIDSGRDCIPPVRYSDKHVSNSNCGGQTPTASKIRERHLEYGDPSAVLPTGKSGQIWCPGPDHGSIRPDGHAVNGYGQQLHDLICVGIVSLSRDPCWRRGWKSLPSGVTQSLHGPSECCAYC